jgi:hypothetical protein
VHLVRHEMNVALSLSDDHRHHPAIDERAVLAGGDRAVGGGGFWAIQNEKMEVFRDSVAGACHVIRYEDLTADPPRRWGRSWRIRSSDRGSGPKHGAARPPRTRGTG